MRRRGGEAEYKESCKLGKNEKERVKAEWKRS
jgi:hypothetical protein